MMELNPESRKLLASFIFVIFIVSSASTVSDIRVVDGTDILRQRIRWLEMRLTEEINLIREEFYIELNSVRRQPGNESSVVENKSAVWFEQQLQSFKNEVAEKLRGLSIGLSDEKRVRRAIQNELNTVKENGICQNVAMEDLIRSLKQVIANISEHYTKDCEKISSVIETGINNLVKRIGVQEDLNEIVEILRIYTDKRDEKNNAKETTEQVAQTVTEKARDCADWRRRGHVSSGVYVVFPETIWRPLKVYCDMEVEGGGWTVFQRRKDGSENFTRNWLDYTYGFGDLEGEFWLGNEFIHRLTSFAPQELRIELEDFDNERRVAEYGRFSVGPESEMFKLSVEFFRGNVSDSLTGKHNEQGFSTADRGPASGCAKQYKGGFWYSTCHHVNVNGAYLRGEHKTFADGVNWFHWRGYHYSLKTTEMKFRSK